jgi:hypothetical protein
LCKVSLDHITEHDHNDNLAADDFDFQLNLNVDDDSINHTD